jgi:BirA family biotin operon repressor/biotin-[acetyl-CoA-carboxylase] ligase
VAEPRYDGYTAEALRALLGLPRVELYESISSTLDVAHSLGGAGASAGTLVLAEQQLAGRGRGGRRWASAPGSGIWLTLVERPADPSAVELLSLRVGIRAAAVLDRWAPEPVRLKWPNDIYCAGGKVAGILIEARWRAERLDWVAVGLGVNIHPPVDMPGAAALREVRSRVELLGELVPALRGAAAARGPLSDRELEVYAERDLARGRRCSQPMPGVVKGIDALGALVVLTPTGEAACRSGSLVFEEER